MFTAHPCGLLFWMERDAKTVEAKRGNQRKIEVKRRMAGFQIYEGDLLEQQVEVIVNPWNRNIFPWWLLIPQGVARAIRRRGGIAPFRELSGKGLIALGDAVVTTAGRLPFKAIIHVAGINLLWVSSEGAIRASVRNCYRFNWRHIFCRTGIITT
jgi:O-acetyl-ADP-ribose deacetylase (regulator of RNase III)